MSESGADEELERSGPTPLPDAILRHLKKGDAPVKPGALNAFSRTVIAHDNFQDGLGCIARIHQEYDPNPDAEAGFALFRGRERSGKSHVLKFYKRKFPKTKGARGWVRPVVYVRAPANGGSVSMQRAILKAMEVQLIGTRGGDDLRADIERHLLEQKVELLIIDEFQHVVDQRTDRFQYAAAEELKNMLSMNCCQMIFAGLDISARVLNLNKQLAGRMSDEISMLPYDWEAKDPKEHYKDYLGALADRMVELGMFSVRPSFDEETLAQRIHCATDGLAGLTSRLLRKAADIAMRAETATVTIDHLRVAFERMKVVGVVVNPFVGDTCPPNLGKPAEKVLYIGEDDKDEVTNLSKRKERAPKASFSR